MPRWVNEDLNESRDMRSKSPSYDDSQIPARPNSSLSSITAPFSDASGPPDSMYPDSDLDPEEQIEHRVDNSRNTQSKRKEPEGVNSFEQFCRVLLAQRCCYDCVAIQFMLVMCSLVIMY